MERDNGAEAPDKKSMAHRATKLRFSFAEINTHDTGRGFLARHGSE